MHQAPRIHSIVLAAFAVTLLVVPLAANAFDPFLITPDSQTLQQAPSYRYANMGSDQVLAELQSRSISFQQVKNPVQGVVTPIRLTGPLHGVRIHSALPESARSDTPFEICDARLALALDDFAAVLQGHDVDELIHYSMYRPTPVRASSPRIQPVAPLAPLPSPAALPATSSVPHHSPGAAPSASTNARPIATTRPSSSDPDTSQSPSTSRHPAGLAIDVAMLHRRTGQWLSVAGDFAGHVGARTCGSGVPSPISDKAKELQAIVCESANNRLFTYVLTPNYNLAHRDHFHMEIKPATRWFLYH